MAPGTRQAGAPWPLDLEPLSTSPSTDSGTVPTWLPWRRARSRFGIDSLNIDSTADLKRPVHTTLLAAGIPIVEHMTGLDQLPDEGFEVTALPAPIEGLGSFPVRVVARVSR